MKNRLIASTLYPPAEKTKKQKKQESLENEVEALDSALSAQ